MIDKPILGFFKEYRFLSNFHLVEIVHNELKFPSTENAYQYAKCANQKENLIKAFQKATPAEARMIGRQITIRPDWEEIKFEIMYKLNYQKFTENVELKELLLLTGNAYLEETNHWNDTYWGVCNGEGENNLGKILMAIRNKLQTGDN